MIDPAHKIGYVKLNQFNEESDLQIDKALRDLQGQGMRGLVFDLRGNPGGLLDIAQQIASRFIPAGPIVWIKSKTETMDTMEHLDVLQNEHRNHLRYPLVVLVDGGSASAAEIVSGAIKDTRTGPDRRKDVWEGTGPDHHAAAGPVSRRHHDAALLHGA